MAQELTREQPRRVSTLQRRYGLEGPAPKIRPRGRTAQRMARLTEPEPAPVEIPENLLTVPMSVDDLHRVVAELADLGIEGNDTVHLVLSDDVPTTIVGVMGPDSEPAGE